MVVWGLWKWGQWDTMNVGMGKYWTTVFMLDYHHYQRWQIIYEEQHVSCKGWMYMPGVHGGSSFSQCLTFYKWDFTLYMNKVSHIGIPHSHRCVHQNYGWTFTNAYILDGYIVYYIINLISQMFIIYHRSLLIHQFLHSHFLWYFRNA